MPIQVDLIPPPSDGMTLTEARAIVLQFARNASGSPAPYEPDEVDRAIQFVGNHFCRTTQAVKQLASTNLAAGSYTIDTTGWGGFRPEMVLNTYVVDQPGRVDKVTWDELRNLRACRPASGVPRKIAFETWSQATVYPTPDASYEVRVKWWSPFTAWTAGTDTPDDVVLNIPTDWLNEILPYGPPAVLQHGEVESQYALSSCKMYMDLVNSLIGAGGDGADTAERTNPWECVSPPSSGCW